MELKKIATNSLPQLLIAFQTAIAPLLEIGNIEEWDGRTLKEREEKIREIGLILVGKCIVILLEKLASSEEAQLKAIEQTKGWWRTKTKKNGTKPWTRFAALAP